MTASSTVLLPPLLVDVEVADGVAVLRLRGALAGAAARHAREAMSSALAEAPRDVVVDLSGVTSAEDPGAVLLVAMRRHAHRLGSTPRFVGVGAGVRQVLRRRGIDRLLDIEDECAEGRAGEPAVRSARRVQAGV